MKKALCLFILISINCVAQSDPGLELLHSNNFEVKENKNLTWQKIYNDSISPQTLLKSLQDSGKFESIQFVEDNIEFTLKFIRDDFKKYGYKAMTDAMLFTNGGTCKGRIEFKDSKYRTTIFFIEINDPSMGIGNLPLYSYIFKGNGKVKTVETFKRAVGYFNGFFTDTFASKEITDEW